MSEPARLEELGIKPRDCESTGDKNNAWPRGLEIKCC